MKYLIKQFLAKKGYEIISLRPGSNPDWPIELSESDVKFIKYIEENELSMVPRRGLIATSLACRYIIREKLDGDFVECGVWRGGNSLLAKMIFDDSGSKNRNVWLFDTFEGMPEPTLHDSLIPNGESAITEFEKNKTKAGSDWAYASLEFVMTAFEKAGARDSRVHFIKGDVADTLKTSMKIPSQIAVLRLDTDWYESTRLELETLYPILERKGVLIIDDYGHWAGAKKAVDEFFINEKIKYFLIPIDHSIRVLVK